MPGRLAAAQEVADRDNIVSHPRAIFSGGTGQLSSDGQCSSTTDGRVIGCKPRSGTILAAELICTGSRAVSCDPQRTHRWAIVKRDTHGGTRRCKPPEGSDQGQVGICRRCSGGVRNAERPRRACFEKLCIVGAVLWTSCVLRSANGNPNVLDGPCRARGRTFLLAKHLGQYGKSSGELAPAA